MIGFIIGLFVGGFLGVFIMCLCNVASRADDDIERMDVKGVEKDGEHQKK